MYSRERTKASLKHSPPSSTSKKRTKTESEQELTSYEVPQHGGMINNINRSLESGFYPFSQTSMGVIQTKLTVGAPGDKYEQEADQVASQVVQEINTPQTSIQREMKPEDEDEPMQAKFESIQRTASPEEEEEVQAKFESIQRTASPEEEEEVQAKFESIQRTENPEEEELQAKFESIQRTENPEEEEKI